MSKGHKYPEDLFPQTFTQVLQSKISCMLVPHVPATSHYCLNDPPLHLWLTGPLYIFQIVLEPVGGWIQDWNITQVGARKIKIDPPHTGTHTLFAHNIGH